MNPGLSETPEPPVAELLKASFAPVADGRTQVLVLGSLPGEISLARGQYYANPQNQFWRLIGAVIGAELVGLEYEARLQRLLEAGVGLWDVIATAERAGSLDGAIRAHTPNALAELAASLPELKAIGFNGGKSLHIGRPALGEAGNLALVALPSSSPAFTRRFEEKLAAWMSLRAFLDRASD
ncbi:MAG TPA: DNA-deoxyinosine glycosylase [Caulobacteraceae bacterium]